MRFLQSIETQIRSHAEKPWCFIHGKHHSYADLSVFIGAHQSEISQSAKPIGVVIRNDFETYAALITCWISGKAYVPLNPEYPKERLKDIIEASNIQQIFDSKGTGLIAFPELLLVKKHPTPNSDWKLFTPQSSDWAYILFTSGTTGKPKGVPIGFGNLEAFFDGFFALGYDLNSQDRFLNMFELSFDLSVMSFGVPSILGASFYVPQQNLVKPLALYDALESNDITFALMVPSVVEMLAPYADELDLPHLKVSQFCGEALKLSQLKVWKQACPQTQIDNVYGPTEATIYCTRYTVPKDLDECLHKNGIVCIGTAMKHVSLWMDPNFELCLGGLQTTEGYLQATADQKSKFFEMNQTWFYKSGDIASYSEGYFYCHGRSDDQIKIQGYRVELSEIEFAGNKAFPDVLNKCLALQTEMGWELHLVFDTDQTLPPIQQINAFLPDYMHIKQVHASHPFPLNDNGKIDKKQLTMNVLGAST